MAESESFMLLATTYVSSSISLTMAIAIAFSIATYYLVPLLVNGRCENWKNAPPGPVGWPILGNLPQLSERIHEEFFKMSQKYGPIISLKMGMKPAIVISSPETAYEVMKVKEGSFSSRTITETSKVISYDASSIVFSPYGPRWKLLRRILITEVFANKSFEKFEPLRTQEVHGLLRRLHKTSSSKSGVNIGECAFTALANLVSTILWSKKHFGDNIQGTSELKDAFWGMIKVMGQPNLADLIPILKPFDLQGLKRKTMKIFEKLDIFYENLIQERLNERRNGIKRNTDDKDLLDIFLDYYRDDKNYKESESLSKNAVKGMLSEIFIAGTETTSSTVEWGMTEILRNPHVHKKLVAELDLVIGKNRFVRESDFENLPYLQAVCKEILRLHPGVPLVVPRRANENCEVAGYHIPKDCTVYVNVWGIARDPKVWENPLEFNPERFVGSKVDVKGQDFNLLPFGTGRRSCIGWPLGHRMLHFYVAAFLHCFEWDCYAEGLNDMTESFGLTLQKEKSLIGYPKPRLPDSAFQY